MAWLDRFSSVCSHRFSRPCKGIGSGVLSRTAIIAGLSLGIVALAVGCGNQYRPVVTPLYPTGPAGQPTAYITVYSQPGFTQYTGGGNPCPTTSYSTPSVITLLDFAGDTILSEAQGGYGPLTFSLEQGAAQTFSPNCDGTLTTAPNSPGTSDSGLITKEIQTSTLLPGSEPTNVLLNDSDLYVTEAGLHGPTCLTTNCVAELTGSPPALQQEIPVAPSLVNLVSSGDSPRIYAISQGNSSGTPPQPAWGTCDDPSSVTADGEADAIEASSNTISARLPLGICPVYGLMLPSTYRTFIMNRGGVGTVTVINSQLNAIDTTFNTPNPTGTIKLGTATNPAGPVYADYYENGQVLVTANYDSSTISIIDVSLDVYGNDSSAFGTVLATVNLANGPGCPTGADTMCMHPVAVSVLQDGSRVYVANQGDPAAGVAGSVEVVNLSNYTVESVIPLPSGFYPHAIGSVYNYPYGKVYVSSQYSPYLEIIYTNTDTISDTADMQGDIVDMHVNYQNPSVSLSNFQVESRSVGSGAP
jgi:hypothetical protein